MCDLCAAPGSPTSHLAQLMQNQGLIVANEPVQGRLAMLDSNLSRHLFGRCDCVAALRTRPSLGSICWRTVRMARIAATGAKTAP